MMLIIVASTACGKLSTNFPDPTQGMRFATASYGQDHAARSRHVDLPFRLSQQGTNGTALLLGFLQAAEGSGAKYVSNVSYALEFIYHGSPVECESTIFVDDGSGLPPAPPPAEPPADADYSTTVKPWSPDIQDGSVVDREMRCERRAVTSTHVENRWDADYAPEALRIPTAEARGAWSGFVPMFDGRTVEVNDATFYDACSFDAEKRSVHRYAHFIAAKFVPPDLDRLRKIYSDFKLVEMPPRCHRIDRVAGAPLRHHITADVHFVGTVDTLRETVPTPVIGYHP